MKCLFSAIARVFNNPDVVGVLVKKGGNGPSEGFSFIRSIFRGNISENRSNIMLKIFMVLYGEKDFERVADVVVQDLRILVSPDLKPNSECGIIFGDVII